MDFRVTNPITGKSERHRRRLPKGTTRKQAKSLATLMHAQKLRDVVSGPPSEETGIRSLESFADEWLRIYAVPKLKAATTRKYRSNLGNHVYPELGSMRLSDVSAKTLETLQATLDESGLSPKTTNNIVGMVQKILKDAVRWKELDVAPSVDPLSWERPPIPYMSPEDEKRIIDVADPDWRPMIVVALRTGLRRGELVGLHRDDIDWRTSRIHVRRSVVRKVEGLPKGGRSRWVELSGTAVAMLKEAIAIGGGSELVFPGKSSGYIPEGSLKHPIERIRKRTGIEKLGWHSLRHAFGTRLSEKGVEIRKIQDLMGHADIRQTQRYMNVAPPKKEGSRAVDLLD